MCIPKRFSEIPTEKKDGVFWKFFKVEQYDDDGEHMGSSWHMHEGYARKAINAHLYNHGLIGPEVTRDPGDYYQLTEVDVDPGKPGILRLLREHASHPDNG